MWGNNHFYKGFFNWFDELYIFDRYTSSETEARASMLDELSIDVDRSPEFVMLYYEANPEKCKIKKLRERTR